MGRRSTLHITLVLVGTLAVAGCSRKEERHVYTNKQECLDDWNNDPQKCEEAGINIFPEFPAGEVLYDENDAVIGVRTGDKGIDKDGKQKANYEPGELIKVIKLSNLFDNAPC